MFRGLLYAGRLFIGKLFGRGIVPPVEEPAFDIDVYSGVGQRSFADDDQELLEILSIILQSGVLE